MDVVCGDGREEERRGGVVVEVCARAKASLPEIMPSSDLAAVVAVLPPYVQGGESPQALNLRDRPEPDQVSAEGGAL